MTAAFAIVAVVGVLAWLAFFLALRSSRRNWYTRAKWAPLDRTFNFHPTGSRLSVVDRIFVEAADLDAFELEERSGEGRIALRVRRGSIRLREIGRIAEHLPAHIVLDVIPNGQSTASWSLACGPWGYP